MKKYPLPAACLFALMLCAKPSPVSAQDFHLSQYDMLPLYYNPAQTGMFSADDMKFRLCGTYRSQWQKLQGKPYSSIGTSYDMPYKRFGFGGLLMDHIAGTSNFSTFQFLLSGAYKITSDDSKNHFLYAGLQMGLFQKRFSDADLYFEDQYTTTDGIDPNLPTGESFTNQNQSIIRFDANMGIFYRYVDPNQRFDPSAGFSVYHVTTPNESFTGQKSRLPMRFNGTVACDIHANENLTFTPNCLFMYQRKAMELNAGLMAGYTMPDSPYNLMLGGSYRYKDAVVIHLGIKQGNNIFRISYDIVTSPLKRFGGSRGGFEMGVIYTGAQKGAGHVNSSI